MDGWVSVDMRTGIDMCLGREGRTMCWGYPGGWRDHWMEDQVVLESHCLCSEVITEPRRAAAEVPVTLRVGGSTPGPHVQCGFSIPK